MTCPRPMYHPYNDVIIASIASQITSLAIVYSAVYSGADERKHQSSASLAFVRGIHRGPVNSPHKWPVTLKLFPFDDVIMSLCLQMATVLTPSWLLNHFVIHSFDISCFKYIYSATCHHSKWPTRSSEILRPRVFCSLSSSNWSQCIYQYVRKIPDRTTVSLTTKITIHQQHHSLPHGYFWKGWLISAIWLVSFLLDAWSF